MFVLFGTLFDVVSPPKKITQLSISQWVKRLRECEHQLLGLCESRCVVSKIDRWKYFFYLWKFGFMICLAICETKKIKKNNFLMSFFQQGWLRYGPLCRIPDPHATKKCGISIQFPTSRSWWWIFFIIRNPGKTILPGKKKLLCQHCLQSFFGTFEPCKRKTEGIWCLRVTRNPDGNRSVEMCRHL